jgi:alkanesulfonate monooxygenase
MNTAQSDSGVSIFATCPQSSTIARDVYLQRVIDVARWSERAGCAGILVYSDNSLVDPWLVAQIIVQNTERLSPLVAVQPVYMHPYTVAKMIATLGHLYRRRIDLNMIAGGFKNDLNALNDPTAHDRRYDRLVEYTNIVKLLLTGEQPVTFAGEFYQVRQLKLAPRLSRELLPNVLMSGSSPAGAAAAKATGSISVEYPLPSSGPSRWIPAADVQVGIRVGIIARETASDAWTVAHERFPSERKGQLMHELAMKVSDSAWHRILSEADKSTGEGPSPYWLEPFRNYQTFCPYLVGSYEQVAQEMAQYLRAGCRAVILDIPANEEELGHIGVVFRQAFTTVGH